VKEWKAFIAFHFFAPFDFSVSQDASIPDEFTTHFLTGTDRILTIFLTGRRARSAQTEGTGQQSWHY
jgi:hypothetical protein